MPGLRLRFLFNFYWFGSSCLHLDLLWTNLWLFNLFGGLFLYNFLELYNRKCFFTHPFHLFNKFLCTSFYLFNLFLELLFNLFLEFLFNLLYEVIIIVYGGKIFDCILTYCLVFYFLFSNGFLESFNCLFGFFYILLEVGYKT